jgi:PAS domain-containing protein
VAIGVSVVRAGARLAFVTSGFGPAVDGDPALPVRFGIVALGDLLGILLVGSALLAWLSGPAKPATPEASEPREPGRVIELLLLALLTAVTTAALFGGLPLEDGPSFLLVPALLWGGLRFGVRGATLVSLITAALSLFLTHHGSGPLRADSLLSQVLQLQVFLGVAAGAGLIFAAAWTERDEIAHEVRRSAARYRSLVDGLPDGLLRLDAKGVVLDLVAHAGPLRALQSGSVGKPLEQLLGSATAATLLHAAEEARAAGSTVQCALQLLGPDGPRDVECSVSPAEAGEVTVLARDVTELRRLQTQVLLSGSRRWARSLRASRTRSTTRSPS